MILQVKFFLSYLAQDICKLCKILQVTRFFFSKLGTNYITCSSLCNIVHNFASQYFFSYLAQDFAIMRKILLVTRFFLKTCSKLYNLRKFIQILQVKIFVHIMRKILRYCARFCKLQDFIFQNLQQIT